jgi:hypothetical protein
MYYYSTSIFSPPPDKCRISDQNPTFEVLTAMKTHVGVVGLNSVKTEAVCSSETVVST